MCPHIMAFANYACVQSVTAILSSESNSPSEATKRLFSFLQATSFLARSLFFPHKNSSFHYPGFSVFDLYFGR